MYDKSFDAQKGFTLIEVIVAMIIIWLAIVGVAFTVVTVSRIGKSNQVNLVATRYANDVMEKIKSYQFSGSNGIGFTDGSPTGCFVRAWNGGQLYNKATPGFYTYSIPPLGNLGNQYWTFGTVTYKPQINIWWTLPQDVTTTVQEFPADTYKTVEVSVYATDSNNNLLRVIYVNSMISPGQAPGSYTGGNLLATAKVLSSPGNVLKNINLSMIDAPPGQTYLSGVTGDDGTMPFFQISTGNYDLQASSDDPGWMVEPDNVEQIINNLPSGQTTPVNVYVDQPCYLTVSPTPNAVTSGTAILNIPYGNYGNYNISVPFTSNTSLELWPALTYSYNVQILVNGYIPWSGSVQFGAPGTSETITPALTACNATVTVTDQMSATPVVGASVGITSTHYTWDSLHSAYDSSSVTTYANTDSLGQALFIDPSSIATDALGSHQRYKPDGLDDDYYNFGIIATDQAYAPYSYPFGQNPIQATNSVPMSYNQALPDIRVRAQYGPNGSAGSHGPTIYAAGYPRWGATVTATGPATYIATLNTVGTDGYAEVDFPNVVAGSYTISCSTGNNTPSSKVWTINLGDYLVIASW